MTLTLYKTREKYVKMLTNSHLSYYFVVLEFNVCKLSFGVFMLLECYILRLIALKNLSCWKLLA